jgi:hypothetical protein
MVDTPDVAAGAAPIAPESSVPWARQAAAPQPRATSRTRQMVHGLPAWEPLPPGELLVHRHRRE